jgi:hypothetical protein
MYRRLEVDMEELLLTKEWGRASEEARYLCWGSSAEIAVGAGAKGNVRGLENTRKSRSEKKINLYNLVVSAHLEHSFTFPLSGNSVRRRVPQGR